MLTAVTLAAHLLSRLMLTADFGDQGVAEFGVVSFIFILLVTAVQLVLAIIVQSARKKV